MGKTQVIYFIQSIKNLVSLSRQFFPVFNWLASASGAAARTGHDLYEIILHLSLSDSIHKPSGISQSAGNSYFNGLPCQIKFSFLPAFHSSYLKESGSGFRPVIR